MKAWNQIQLCAMLAVIGCMSSSCAPGAKAPTKDAVACYAHMLEPVAAEVYDVDELAKDLIDGKVRLGAVVQSLFLTERAALKLADDLKACRAPAAAPTP